MSALLKPLVQGQRELRRQGASRRRRLLQAEAETGQPADTTVAEVEGVVGQGAQPLQVLVEGAEGHDAVARHVLGLVGVRRDLRLGLLAIRVGRGVVIDLREDVVQGSGVVEHERGLLVQRVDDVPVGRAKVLGRAREVGRAAQQAEVERVPLRSNGRQVDAAAMRLPRLGGLRGIETRARCRSAGSDPRSGRRSAGSTRRPRARGGGPGRGRRGPNARGHRSLRRRATGPG